MGDLLTTGSVLAAFFAGGVALFAPCCIVFLPRPISLSPSRTAAGACFPSPSSSQPASPWSWSPSPSE